jgi:hypothetical protein
MDYSKRIDSAYTQIGSFYISTILDNIQDHFFDYFGWYCKGISGKNSRWSGYSSIDTNEFALQVY